MPVVRCLIVDEDLHAMARSSVPIEIGIRLRLQGAGFHFEDDGKPSAALNRSPVFLYPTHCAPDRNTGARSYWQEIPE